MMITLYTIFKQNCNYLFLVYKKTEQDSIHQLDEVTSSQKPYHLKGVIILNTFD